MKHTYKVTGMTCGGCKASVEKTVVTHLDATNGETSIAILSADTVGLKVGEYVYEIRMINGSNETTLLLAKWTILDNNTY